MKAIPSIIISVISSFRSPRAGRQAEGAETVYGVCPHEERLLGEPGMEYYKLLDDGYARWGFDAEILDKGLSDSIGVKAAKAYIREYQGL